MPPVGLKKIEVSHEFISGPKEQLNQTVAQYLADGWYILDAKFIQGDFYNGIFSVMYIFSRNSKTVRDE